MGERKIAPEFVEIGTLWLEVHHGVRVDQGKVQPLLMPTDAPIPQYRILTSSLDPKSGYGVFVVTPAEKYASLGHTIKDMLLFLRASKRCFDAAMRNILKDAAGEEPGEKDEDDGDVNFKS